MVNIRKLICVETNAPPPFSGIAPYSNYYKVRLLWATWVYSYWILLGSYAYCLIDSICVYFPELHSNWLRSWSDLRVQQCVKIILYIIFLITYQNFFCIQGKHRFTRRWSSYVTIWLMEVQKWWIWEKREKIPLGTQSYIYVILSHITFFPILERKINGMGHKEVGKSHRKQRHKDCKKQPEEWTVTDWTYTKVSY